MADYSQEAFDYDDWFAANVGVHEARKCGLSCFSIEGRDAFLAAFTPFRHYQLMPFGSDLNCANVDECGRRLRLDFHQIAQLQGWGHCSLRIKNRRGHREHFCAQLQ